MIYSKQMKYAYADIVSLANINFV